MKGKGTSISTNAEVRSDKIYLEFFLFVCYWDVLVYNIIQFQV